MEWTFDKASAAARKIDNVFASFGDLVNDLEDGMTTLANEVAIKKAKILVLKDEVGTCTSKIDEAETLKANLQSLMTKRV